MPNVNEENSDVRIKRPPRGPGMRRNPLDKAKNFKSAIKRLFKELKRFRIMIAIALILAVLGAILSILAPNKLSDLTDEISKGLVINQDNLEILINKISDNVNEDKLKEILPQILDMDLSNENITNIMMSDNISNKEKQNFQLLIKDLASSQNEDSFQKLATLDDSILKFLFKDSTYNDVKILASDKITLLKSIKSMNKDNFFNLPDSIKQVLFEDIVIDSVTITSDDQIALVNEMSNFNELEAEQLYEKIDKMPDSIKEVIKPFMDIDKIKSITLFLGALFVCSAIFTYIESILMTSVANNFARSLRGKISKKINLLPLSYFDNHATGDILSRVTNDVDTIAQTMNQSLATLVSAITLFVGTIIMMFYTNFIMAITAILSSLFGFMFMFAILSKSQKYFVARQVELGNLNGHIEEIYSGLNIVKTYNGKAESDKTFDKYNKSVYEANRKSQFLSGLMMPMMNFIGNFGYVAVCIVGALLTMNGNISFGVIVAFISYVRLFTSPLSQIAQAMTSMQSTAAASERVFEFLDEKEMKDQKSIKCRLDKSKVKGKIEFDNVVFKYDNNDHPTIKNFTATALPGQKIAIVGPTGAGKTTMVNLLMKFYDIKSGDIRIDGVSTKNLTRENIHELFTMVLQDTWLFNGTVRENIVYNRENVDDKRVEEVCKIVGLDHFIKTLPHGYDSLLSESDSVSAGQRQLLTIARGMIENAPFLILDEATSNVDTRTEELVQNAMDILTRGRTSFIIAHRLSTIKNADLILVMQEGNIVEQGNHEELMKQNGAYAKLYNSQFEL